MSQSREDDHGRARTRSIRPVLLGIAAIVVAGTVLLAIVLIGGGSKQSSVGTGTKRSQTASAPMHTPMQTTSPAPSGPPTMSFNRASRRFSVGGLQGTLPAHSHMQGPYGFNDIGGPAVIGCITCFDNSPSAAFAEASGIEEPLTGANINQTADKLFSWLQTASGQASTAGGFHVKDERQRTLQKNSARPVRIITAVLHSPRAWGENYLGKPAPSHFYLLVEKETSGGYLAYYAMWTEAVPPAIGKAMQDSIKSLKVVQTIHH